MTTRPNCDHFFHYGCFKACVEEKKTETSCPTCCHDFKFTNDNHELIHQLDRLETYQLFNLRSMMPLLVAAVSVVALSSLVLNRVETQFVRPVRHEPIRDIPMISGDLLMSGFRRHDRSNVSPRPMQDEALEEMNRNLERNREIIRIFQSDKNQVSDPKEFSKDKSDENK